MLTSIIAGAIIGMIAGEHLLRQTTVVVVWEILSLGLLVRGLGSCSLVVGALIGWHGSGTVSLWSSIVGGHFSSSRRS